MSAFQLIGTVQLRALVGSPQAEHAHPAEILQAVGFHAVQEAQTLVQAGFDAILLQNFGDSPYFQSQVPSETIACMAIITAAVREAVQVSLGVQVLGNDGQAALAIASVTGCDFIRVKSALGKFGSSNELAELLRERERLHSSVNVLTEVEIRNFSGLSSPENSQIKSWMDGVILVSDSRNSIESQISSAGLSHLKKGKVPLYLDVDHPELLEMLKTSLPLSVSGLILSSFVRKGGPDGPIDLKYAREVVRDLKKARKPISRVSQKKIKEKQSKAGARRK